MIYKNLKSWHIRSVAIIFIASVMILLQGCKTHKETASTDYSGASVMPKNVAERLGGVTGRYGEWQRLRMPVNLKVNAPTSMSVSGTVTMEYGKSILVSMRVIGMEVAVIYIDNDSVLIADKYHKRYFSDKISNLLGGIDIKVSNLQNLLLGRIFSTVGNDIPRSVSGFSVDNITAGDGWIMSAELPRYSYGFIFKPWDILSTTAISVVRYQPVIAEYGQDIKTSAGVFADRIDISAAIKDKALSATLQWGFDKAKWNDNVELRVPKIGTNYRRLSVAEVAGMF